jgi:putative tricarboxylic transport membrane protein
VGRPERIGRIFAKLSEIVRSAGTMIRGSFVGFIVGILPGAGGTVASFVAYSMEKRFWGG